MIPKIIHYCWFGGKKKSPLALKCIASWRKFCPDYEIKEWNENNYDINKCLFIKEAYEAKKWAFITDYVRLDVLFHIGGIYMDVDVEVLKNLNGFLVHDAFTGFQLPDEIPTGIMAAKAGQILFEELLHYYDNRHFILQDNSLDMTTNVVIITNICKKYGIKLDNSYQVIKGCVFYPWEYFCPIQLRPNYGYYPTKNTVTIHHFTGTWMPKRKKFKRKIQKLLGDKITQKIVKIKNLFRRK